MPDPKTPTPFRLALCPEGRSTNVQWLGDDHPAQILLHVDQTPALPTAWTFLSEFGLRDVMLHRREHPRRVGRGMDITSARLSLFNERDDELLICTAVGAPLDERHCAILGGICLLASGGMGMNTEAVAATAREVDKDEELDTNITKRATSDALKVEPLIRTIGAEVMKPNATVSLTPARYRDDEPADLNIGDLSFRIYDRQSFAVAAMLVNFSLAIQASLRALTAGGRRE